MGWLAVAGAWSPRLAASSERLRIGMEGRRTVSNFVLSAAAVNLTSLLGQGLAFRWVDPASMGVWHSLLLLSTYLSVLRLGLINGMGRELPYALGRGDRAEARRIAATSLAWNAVCSALAGLTFVALWAVFWSSGPAWRAALPAMAVMSASNFYLAYLQATFRSDSDFERLARVQWVQAAIGILMPLTVYAFGFAGLVGYAALQAVLVTAFAHACRPIRVGPRFEFALARRLLATGLPLFLAGYLQTLAIGFDRVILLHRGTVATLGYYAPAAAVLSAMAIVPGAVSSYIYPRMSHALGEGRTPWAVTRMALRAGAISIVVGLPLVATGWFAAPAVISRFFPQYAASIPAVRWSLWAGLAWSLSPATQVLGSLKAWPRLSVYIALLLATRWILPWVLSEWHEPLEGVARGNLWAAVVTGAASLWLVRGAAARPRLQEVAA
jgi:O-antigen/teichoic acid export membrane protein